MHGAATCSIYPLPIFSNSVLHIGYISQMVERRYDDLEIA